MKEIEKYTDICYTKSLIMKSYLKLGITCASAVLGVAAFVTGITLGLVHFKNTAGRGGFDSQTSTPLVESYLAESENLAQEADIYSEEDSELSYISYRIKKGDMIGFIAEEFGVTQDTIISVNNIHSSRLIQIGQYIKIPSMPGILYTVKNDGETVSTIAEKYKVDAEKCSRVNYLGLTEPLAAGKSLFVPHAELDWVTRQEINGDLFIKPIRSRFYFTSYFGWRVNPFDASKRTYHNGIDMACPKGTNIYAALPGKVVQAGYSEIYGNYAIVAHHSGYKTLYGHMSETLVHAGMYVDTNTRIGRVGNTGMSTGPHLHFTVYKNGRPVNPAYLWK